MVTPFPEFAEYFRALYGYDPFPWQERLAKDVAEQGWPRAIGVPTGLGKTACIDIAIWTLARQSSLAPACRTAPTRVWYVVDRRLLIDRALTHGEFLRDIFREPACLRSHRPDATDQEVECIGHMAAALDHIASLGTKRSPLHVVRLRGGAELGQRSPDPSQPALIFATVAMYASRLLFRGYGSSRLIRPVDAALAGVDSLVLLDEAHIAQPLMNLLKAARACDADDPLPVLPPSRSAPRLVPLTATGDRTSDRFDIDDVDRRHDVIRRRLHARKPTALVATTSKSMRDTLAAEALSLARSAQATVVFCNTAQLARAVYDIVERGTPSTENELLTGRMREREAAGARARIMERVGSGRDRSARFDRPLVVVATQTLEVGADLDFDGLVTECASARALVQRFGRLNRLGHFDGARAVICNASDAALSPVYGDEPAAVWATLTTHADLDMCPATISELVGVPDEVATRSRELLPAHLWEYAKTTDQEVDEPDVELFFSGIDDVTRTVGVVWRAHLPDEGAPGGRRIEPHIRDEESAEVPLREVRDFFKRRTIEKTDRIAGNGTSLEHVPIGWLRPGDTVVLRTSQRGYDKKGWAPDATEEVLDVRTLAWPTLWLDKDGGGIAAILGRPHPSGEQRVLLTAVLGAAEDEEEDPPTTRAAVLALVREIRSSGGHPWLEAAEWDAYCDGLADAATTRAVDAVLERSLDGTWMLQARRTKSGREGASVRADAYDDLSFGIDVKSPTLDAHLKSVGAIARGVARQIGLPELLQIAVERAGESHDLGKADPRFQRLLDPHGRHAQLMAKSTYKLEPGRSSVDWPTGARHEVISAQILEHWRESQAPADAIDWELVLHLVITHHGYGRPLVAPVAKAGPVTVPGIAHDDGAAVSVAANLATVDWTQPRRFRMLCERYGYWGLALLEAIVRQSDHAASAELGAESVTVSVA